MQRESKYFPGMTLSSVLACIFCMLVMGMFTQYSDLFICLTFASEHTLALPAFWVMVPVILISGMMFLMTRLRLLTRAELLCVMYAMLISAPLLTQGFWHRLVAVTATNPRQKDFEKLDAMNDRLWSHGPNLIQNAFRKDNPDLGSQGNVAWEEVEYEEGRKAVVPVFVNKGKDAMSSIRIRLPIEGRGKPFVVPGEQYMVSVLTKATELGPTAVVFCRVYNDTNETFNLFFKSTAGPKVSFLHRKGFIRAGEYGVKFSTEARQSYILEFGLEGDGRLELVDPKLFSVAAMETLYKGKKIVSESRFEQLTVAERANLIVKPDNMWSLAGVGFLLSGYIPIRDWIGPIATWTAFVMLLLLATLALNILLRRQWIDNERYLMPVSRIPTILIDDEGDGNGAFPSIWKNRVMYIGFAVALGWMLMKLWHFYNPKVPNMTIYVPLREFFPDPGWGNMWNLWRFEIEGIFLPMCIFMELNVLMSLVIGYMLFKSQSWIGQMTGMTVDPNYPYNVEQTMGAYLAYAAIVLFFTRKYLWKVFKAAVLGDRAASEGEALSYRSALLMFIATVIGSALWARWLGIAPASLLIFFIFLVAIGFVASKLRTECGTPWGYFAPANLAMFLGLLGGVWRFGPEAMMFCYIASFMLGPTVFFLIPGAQMELLGVGKRWSVRPRDLVLCTIVGVLGGMIIGGWVFLSNAYSLGGETCKYSWAFDSKPWYFYAYNQDMAIANNNFLGAVKGAVSGGISHAWYAFGFSAIVTVILTVLRQLFSGFWFHPVGFVLGSTNFMDYIWGSALTAWVIRSVVLRLGGAATVRNKLQPFFVGFFLGACTGYLVALVYGAYLRSIGIDKIYQILTS